MARFIKFPQDATKIESCRRAVSSFGEALDKGLGDLIVHWTTGPCTARDSKAIDGANVFAAACESIFSNMVDGIKCGTTSHEAELHLSGFKEDQLKMNVRTCKGTNWTSAIFNQ